MSKKTITRTEYFQLQGMTLIANRLYRRILDLIEASKALIGEDVKEYGHIDDLMWSDHYTVDETLRKLDIEVEPEKPTGGWELEPVILDEKGPEERQGYMLVRRQGEQREHVPLNPEAADIVRALIKAAAPSGPPEDLKAAQ